MFVVVAYGNTGNKEEKKEEKKDDPKKLEEEKQLAEELQKQNKHKDDEKIRDTRVTYGELKNLTLWYMIGFGPSILVCYAIAPYSFIDCVTGHEWYSHFLFAISRAFSTVLQLYGIYSLERGKLTLQKTIKYIIPIIQEQNSYLSLYMSVCVLSAYVSEVITIFTFLILFGGFIDVILKAMGTLMGLMLISVKASKKLTDIMISATDWQSMRLITGVDERTMAKVISFITFVLRDMTQLCASAYLTLSGKCAEKSAMSYYIFVMIAQKSLSASIGVWQAGIKQVGYPQHCGFFTKEIVKEDDIVSVRNQLFNLPTRAATIKLNLEAKEKVDTSFLCLKGDLLNPEDYYASVIFANAPEADLNCLQYLDLSNSKIDGTGLDQLCIFVKTLTYLNLGNNLITDEKFTPILDAFNSSEVIKCISVANNKIGAISISRLMLFIQARKPKTFIANIENNDFDARIIKNAMFKCICKPIEEPVEQTEDVDEKEVIDKKKEEIGFTYCEAETMKFYYTKIPYEKMEKKELTEESQLLKHVKENEFYEIQNENTLSSPLEKTDDSALNSIVLNVLGTNKAKLITYGLRALGAGLAILLSAIVIIMYNGRDLKELCLMCFVFSGVNIVVMIYKILVTVKGSVYYKGLLNLFIIFVDMTIFLGLISISAILFDSNEKSASYWVISGAFLLTYCGTVMWTLPILLAVTLCYIFIMSILYIIVAVCNIDLNKYNPATLLEKLQILIKISVGTDGRIDKEIL